MRRLVPAVVLIAASAFTLGAVLAPSSPTQAAGEREFLLGAGDGYGVDECLADGGACGRLVADAWCEGQGYARSANVRRAEASDATAAVPAIAGKLDAVVITCKR